MASHAQQEQAKKVDNTEKILRDIRFYQHFTFFAIIVTLLLVFFK